MTEFLLPPGFQATNSDDSPLAGGYYLFFSAATTTPKAVYSDSGRSVSLGTQVNLNSSGAPVSGSNVPVLIYLGTGAYKVELYDADDTKLYTFDNIPGYVEPEEEATTATPVTPVISKTSSYVVTSDDRGKLINANPTGGSFTITCPSAVEVGDNFIFGVRHNGTANSVPIVAKGGQNIRFQGNRTAFSLNGQGETLWLVSDGSDLIGCGYVPPHRKDTSPYFIVLDRLTAPPANPDSGARYLINGTPTGAWSTLGFADEDIAEADGNGSWIRHTPAEGWMAFDVDEKVSLVFKNGAWENFQIDPGTSSLLTMMVQDQKTSGTVGGTATAGAWTDVVLNSAIVNTITGASLASNTITLPGGPDGAARRYRVKARKTFYRTELSQIRFITTAPVEVARSEVVNAGYLDGSVSANSFTGAIAMLDGEFSITGNTDFKLQYYVSVTRSTSDLGNPASISSTNEIYATIVIEDLTTQQGPTGPQGGNGTDGLDGGYHYQYSTSTSGDPGTGKIRTNHATPASVTQIAVHQTDALGALLTTAIATWDNSDNPSDRATIRWHKEGAPENFLEFTITGDGTDAGDYWTFPVSSGTGSGTISNGNDIAVHVSRTGNKGDPGTTVPDADGLVALPLLSLTADLFTVRDDTDDVTKKATGFLIGLPLAATQFGAVGDGTTDDTTAITAANSASGAKFLSPGAIFDTTIAQSSLTGPYWGRGQIRDADNNLRAPWFSAIGAAPASEGTHSSVLTAFNGDLSKVQIAMEHRITGASTLGQPTSGYKYTPEAYPRYTYLFNSSGYNHGTATNAGRTAAVADRIVFTHSGDGDTMAFNFSGYVSGAKSGATHALANPAGVGIAGEIIAGNDGVYLNAMEINADGGAYDCAAVTLVGNLTRNDDTAALGEWWNGVRIQSKGTDAIDSAYMMTGPHMVGFDAVHGDFGSSKAAATFKADDRIYMNATADTRTVVSKPTLSNDWFEYDTGINGFLFVVNNTGILQVTNNQVTIGSSGNLLVTGNARAAHMIVTDGVTAPSATSGQAKIYVDTADGDLKVIFGDGTIKTLATDT